MRILAFDTTGPSLSVALLSAGRLLYERTQQNGLTHSDSLMPAVDEAFRVANLAPGDMDCFAVAVGPGSFTGVRIGVATAKTLAHVTGKPCYGANALEALAFGVSLFDGIVCPLQDARAGQVYCAAYRGGERVLPDAAEKLAVLLQKIRPLGRCCFVGDGAVAHREAIAQAMGGQAVFAPANAMALRASSVALLAAANEGDWTDWQSLLPYYLRAPQAERERLAREANANG